MDRYADYLKLHCPEQIDGQRQLLDRLDETRTESIPDSLPTSSMNLRSLMVLRLIFENYAKLHSDLRIAEIGGDGTTAVLAYRYFNDYAGYDYYSADPSAADRVKPFGLPRVSFFNRASDRPDGRVYDLLISDHSLSNTSEGKQLDYIVNLARFCHRGLILGDVDEKSKGPGFFGRRMIGRLRRQGLRVEVFTHPAEPTGLLFFEKA